jgi:hypothetical protein
MEENFSFNSFAITYKEISKRIADDKKYCNFAHIQAMQTDSMAEQ